MKSEQAFWTRLRSMLREQKCYALRLEDAAMRGLPDLYVAREGRSAWVELKHVPKLPVRRDTPIRTTLTSEQTAMLREIRVMGGVPTWLCVAIPDRIYLFEWKEAEIVRNGASFVRWKELASYEVPTHSLFPQDKYREEFVRTILELESDD
jgi:hypothetical protein